MFCSYETQQRRWYSHYQEYSHSEFNLDVSRVFYSVVHEPATSFVTFEVQTNSGGYIFFVPGMTVKGVFAMGDGTERRCMAAIDVEKQFADEEEFLGTTRKV